MKTVLVAEFVLAAALLACAQARADVNMWKGVNTNWSDTANWSLGWVPAAGDDVVVTNTANKPYMPAGTYPASGAFASFYVSNSATVYCLGDTGAVNQASGGTAGNPHGTGVWIRCSSATIAGTLSAAGMGFPGGKGPGNSATDDGAAYGGLAGSLQYGITYGSVTNPTALGSGGGSTTYPTAAGGGAIGLEVSGTLTVNGTLSANGGSASGRCGSGGSLYVSCATLAGTGNIQAQGATTKGGGGRVALLYASKSFSGNVSVGSTSVTMTGQQPGTLWEPQRFASMQGSPTSYVDVTITSAYQYYFPDPATNYYWNLTVSNAWFETHGGSLHIGNLTLTNGGFRFDALARKSAGLLDMASIEITNQVRLTGSSALGLTAQEYNLNSLLVATNSILYALGDTNAVNAASGGTTSNKHGQGPLIRCSTATIIGQIIGDGKGFNGVSGAGYGPGGSGYGAAHGGRGAGVIAASGACYGSLTRPTALGSGGAYGNAFGGSAIALDVSGTLQIDGVITMNGVYQSNAGGSGGSIRIDCGTLTGNGTLRANGGKGSSQGGGGGRIAAEYVTSTFGGSNTVLSGTSFSQTGTLFFCKSPYKGTLSGAYNGVSLATTFAKSSFTNGVLITRTIAQWTPRNMIWTDTSMDVASNQLNNVATNLLSGLPVNQKYTITDNGTPMFGGAATNSGASGTLTFAITLDAAHTLQVQATPGGTVITVR